MDDKELVEVWQSEFESEFEKLIPNANLSKHPEGDYVIDPIDTMWQGFLMAKRSQPSVVLPDKDHYYLDDDVYDADEVHERLTAAGIKYTVRGE